jgi:hypothetical protein
VFISFLVQNCISYCTAHKSHFSCFHSFFILLLYRPGITPINYSWFG